MPGYGGGRDPSPLFGAPEGDEDEEQTIGPGEKRMAPDGKYRVLGTDNWASPTDPDWVVGDFGSKQEALKVAREKNKGAAGGRVLDPDDPELQKIHRYYVYDDEGSYIGGDIHNGE